MAGTINSVTSLNTQTYIPFTERDKTPGGGFQAIMEKAAAKAWTDPESAQIREPFRRGAAAPASANEKKLFEQCEALEGFLIKNMLSGMRKTVTKSKLLDTGFAGEMYEDMLWDEYAKEYSKKADFGLAEMAYQELKVLLSENPAG